MVSSLGGRPAGGAEGGAGEDNAPDVGEEILPQAVGDVDGGGVEADAAGGAFGDVHPVDGVAPLL